MFGKRGVNQGNPGGFNAPPTAPELEKKDVPAAAPAAPEKKETAAAPAVAAERVEKAIAKPAPPRTVIKEKTEEYYDIKSSVFTALIDTIDLGQLSRMEADAAREEIRRGATHLKIMASGGVSSPTDRITSTQFSEDELRAIVGEANAGGSSVP